MAQALTNHAYMAMRLVEDPGLSEGTAFAGLLPKNQQKFPPE